jgi:flavin-dependent dehydrogenase
MIRCDAVVAGAGPAGASAAILLARSGWHVILAGDPQAAAPKFGESLPGAGLRLLRDLNVDVSAFGAVHRRIGGNLVCWSTDGLDAADFLNEPDGMGWRLSHAEFDRSLRAAAVAAGTFEVPSPIQTLARGREGWTLKTKSTELIECRWLIDATGRSSGLARRLGVGRIRDEGLVALRGFGTSRAALNRTYIEAVPEGWWYAAALPEGGTVAILHTDPSTAQAARREWQTALGRTAYLRDFFPPQSFPKDGLGGQISVVEAGGSFLERVYDDDWIACGDAAIAFDPLSSQGIYTAMYSGITAAKAVLAADRKDGSMCDMYAQRIREIRRVYRGRLSALYESETRWKDTPFWAARRLGRQVVR